MSAPTHLDWSLSTQWYDENPQSYSDKADALDVSRARDSFVSKLRPGARVLDYGCGSGRDLCHFLQLGFDAHGVDGSAPLVEICRGKIGDNNRVSQMLFQDFSSELGRWDGIWAMASLLHLPQKDLGDHLSLLASTLRPDGTLFACLKSGHEEFVDERGRPMSSVDELTVKALLKDSLPATFSLSITSEESTDTLGHSTGWTNIEINCR
tara:strand:+ start:4607 stop:5233 length:627 start_codon:yes stop_codon:yes gene_type:complete